MQGKKKKKKERKTKTNKKKRKRKKEKKKRWAWRRKGHGVSESSRHYSQGMSTTSRHGTCPTLTQSHARALTVNYTLSSHPFPEGKDNKGPE